MRTKATLVVAAALALARSSSADWLTFGADPQRTGWARSESILNKDNVGTLEIKWKTQLDNVPKELTSLATPVVVEGARLGSGESPGSGGGWPYLSALIYSDGVPILWGIPCRNWKPNAPRSFNSSPP
jgi:hypothetical protein